MSYCNLNMSQCDVTEKSDQVVVNVYNSQANFVNRYVRVPVLNQAYRVYNPAGLKVELFMVLNNSMLTYYLQGNQFHLI